MVPRTKNVECIIFLMNNCKAIPFSQGAQKAIDILAARGAVFTHGGQVVTKLQPMKMQNPSSEHGPDPNFVFLPEAVLDEKGSCLSLNMHHPLLASDWTTLHDRSMGITLGCEFAFGGFGFDASNQGIFVMQGTNATEAWGSLVDKVSVGLLSMANHVYLALRPDYGFVDEHGFNLPQGRALASHSPRYLFWANFFGPEYVESIGREFLKGAPGWISVNLEDGGILHVCTENFQDWWENDQQELLEYFRRRFPKIQVYRATPNPY